MKRCEWAERSEEERIYHDEEWGVEVHDERKLFEFLLLEGAQAGLSWTTVLRKRENYRRLFDGFDPVRVAAYSGERIDRLLQESGIIRNRRKVEGAVTNARAFLRVKEEFGSFDAYIWQFVEGKQIRNSWKSLGEIPARTNESDMMSKDLKKRGFTFMGTTICYAFMQAVGMVSDHLTDCFRYRPPAT